MKLNYISKLISPNLEEIKAENIFNRIPAGKLVEKKKTPVPPDLLALFGGTSSRPYIFLGCVVLKIKNLLSSKLILAAQPGKTLDAAITNEAIRTVASRTASRERLGNAVGRRGGVSFWIEGFIANTGR